MLLMAMAACHNNKEKMENQAKVIELVLYKSQEGVSEREATEAARSVNQFVSRQPGFISRTLYRTEAAVQIDLIYWRSLKEAKEANQAAMQSEVAGKFFATIDQQSIQFMHAEELFSFSVD